MRLGHRLRPAGLAALALALPLGCHAGELGALLKDALNNPAVAAQDAQTQAAQRSLEAATARYAGSGTAGAEETRYESDRFLGVLNPEAFANPPFARNQLRYGASYQLPVDVFGVIAAAREQASKSLDAAQLLGRQQRLLQLHAALSAYVQLQALQRRATALDTQHRRIAATVQRVAAEVASGELADTDLKLAQSELAHLDSLQLQLAGERDVQLADLEAAAGHAQQPANDTIRIPAWNATQPQTLLPAQIAAAQAEAAKAQAREAQRSLWPSLSAGADYYQYEGSGHSDEAWGLGARLSIPLDPSAHLKRAAAAAQAEAASAQQAAAERESRRRIAALKASYDAAVADATAVERELGYRDTVVAVQRELTEAGEQTVEDLLRHERDRADAASREAAAQAQAVTAWSAAQVLMGTPADQYIAALDTP